MLPTEDHSGVIVVPTQGVGKGVYHNREYYGSPQLNMGDVSYHVYITSDEEIKEGDWFIHDKTLKYADSVSLTIEQCLSNFDKLYYKSDCRKIIATTDPKLYQLHDNGVLGQGITRMHQIPQSFIKSFCEKGGIWEVEVDYEEQIGQKKTFLGYEPKTYLTPKLIDNTIVISEVEEKMYSEKKVKSLLLSLAEEVNADSGFGGMPNNQINKWIVENLK